MQETPRKGSDTKERILDLAEAAVLEKGFAATSSELRRAGRLSRVG
jgi:AcrR family transcriptional regulator